jgi:hypothetical protein
MGPDEACPAGDEKERWSGRSRRQSNQLWRCGRRVVNLNGRAAPLVPGRTSQDLATALDKEAARG